MARIRVLSILVAAVAAALLLAGCPGGHDVPVGRLVGHVYAQHDGEVTRAPLADAAVTVQGTGLSTTSDAGGAFALDGVPAGARTLVVTRPGYASVSLPATVVAGQEATAPDGVLTQTPRQWTVLIFMNADGNLEQYGVEDINEMERVAASDAVAVAVQMDRVGGYDTTNGNWTGTKRFSIVHDNNTATMTSTLPTTEGGSPYLEDLGEVNMGQPVALREFIDWGVRAFPAQHYALVIWNHGSGWKSSATRDPLVRGISYDYTSGNNYIHTQDLPAALTSPAPLDIVGFDACLMQQIEVAYEIRNSCRYIVGSEEDEPGPGYDYSTFLAPLVQNPTMTPLALADLIARRSVEIYGADTYSTQSVIDTAELEGVAAALDTFSVALRNAAGGQGAALAAARVAADTYSDYEYKDLADYALNVKARVGATATAADGLVAAVDRAVVSNYHGSVHPAARGLSVFLPAGDFDLGKQLTPAEVFAKYYATAYGELDLSSRTRWDEWLATQAE